MGFETSDDRTPSSVVKKQTDDGWTVVTYNLGEKLIQDQFFVNEADADRYMQGQQALVDGQTNDKDRTVGAADDTSAQQEIEETDKPLGEVKNHPAAGPHAKSHLTDESRTPGAGSLPDNAEDSVSPGSG
jgi:hypothetical protein